LQAKSELSQFAQSMSELALAAGTRTAFRWA
jgi:hypothetical protein